MTNEEIKELEERTYAIGWSGFPIDTLFNDIRYNNDPRFKKDLAYQDFKKVIDEIYILKDKAKKYDDKETPKKVDKYSRHKDLEPTYFCPICENIVEKEHKYCPECGQRLERRR